MTWSLEDRERGLTAWVLAGSSIKASELTGISDSTLRDWKQEDPDRFDKLREDLEPRVVKKIAAEAESLAIQIAEREAKLLDSLDDAAIAKLEAKDIAGTLRNLSTSKALQLDKVSSPLRERPSHVQPTMDLEGLKRQLARSLGFDIDSTAEEMPAAVTLTTESAESNARDVPPA